MNVAPAAPMIKSSALKSLVFKIPTRNMFEFKNDKSANVVYTTHIVDYWKIYVTIFKFHYSVGGPFLKSCREPTI